jgi:PAS domain S-box-containing protein
MVGPHKLIQAFNTFIKEMKSSRASLTDVFFGALFIILIFVSVFSYIKIERLVNASDLVNRTHVVKLKLEQTLSYLKDAETGQRGYLLTKDSSFLQPFKGAFDKARLTAKEIDSLTKENLPQQKNVLTLDFLISDRYDLLNYIIRLSSDSTYSGASLKPYLITAKEKMEGIRNLIASMINLEDEALSKRMEEKNHYAFATPFSLLTLGFFSLGILIVSFFRVRNDLQAQKKLKAELMIQNETFKQAEESSAQGSYSWNLKTGVLTYSDNLYRLLGCESGEFAPSFEKFLEYIHPDDKDYIRKSVKETFRKKEMKISKFRIISKDGKVKYIRGSGKIIRWENEHMVVGTIQDVTNDTLLTEHLKLREEQLTQAQIIGKLGSWEQDFRTNVIKWSDECYRLYGYRPGEINIDDTDFGNVHPDDLPILKAAAQNAREKGIPIDIEYRRKDKNGKTRYIYSKGEINTDSAGNIRGLFGIHMDITQSRENQLQLQESEKFNRTILELVPNIVYIYDIEKRTNVFVNKNILHIIGYSDKEIQEMGADLMNALVHPDDLSNMRAHHENFRYDKSAEVREIEYRFKTKKNEWTYQLSRETVFKRNSEGEVTQIIGVAVDITEIKKANENLKNYNESLTKKNEELERMNTELGSFTYVASHDLQEPLRKIRTFTDLIFEKEVEQLSETTKNYFIRISAAATRMQNLIEALLSYSRTNTTDIIYEPTDLNILLEEVKINLHDVIDEKNAIIESDSLPVVQIIPLQFHQLFLNIISNAIKYSKHGIPPHIKISSQKECGCKINEPGINEKIEYWKISIGDNGIGFEQQYAHKIFELFQRLHGRSEFAGTGIGLAICKKIVQNHNGIISATGNPGVGATFNIFIPASDN